MQEEGTIISDILSKQFIDDIDTSLVCFKSYIRRERLSGESCFPTLEFEIVCKLYKVPGSPLWSEWKSLEELEKLDDTLRKIYPHLFASIIFPKRPAQSWLLSLLGLELCIPEDVAFTESMKRYWDGIMSLQQLADFDSDCCSSVLKGFLHVEFQEQLSFENFIATTSGRKQGRTRSGTMPLRKGHRFSSSKTKLHRGHQNLVGENFSKSISEYTGSNRGNDRVPYVGCPALSLWQGVWYLATIESVNDNTIGVVYEDGTQAEGLIVGKQVILYDRNKDLFPTGQNVIVTSSISGTNLCGKVVQHLASGEYLVEFECGNTEKVLAKRMGLHTPPATT